MTGLAHIVLTIMSGYIQQNHQETLRNKVYYPQVVVEGIRHARGPHSKVLGSAGRGGKTWGSAFIIVPGTCVWGFVGSLFISYLKA